MYTVNNYLRNIIEYFTCLYNSEVIKSNSTVQIRVYKHSRKPKSEIKDVDFNKILKCLDLTSLSEYRNYVILQLLMDAGMRIGETLNLKMEDILIDKKAIFIPAEIAKGRKDRYVFFSTIMQGILKKWILKKWIDYKERYFNTEDVFISTRGSNFNVMNFKKILKNIALESKLKRA